MRRRWLKRGALVAFVYSVLWAATAVWGPAAAGRWDREQQQAHYGSMGVDPEQYGRRLGGFAVPAPFMVMAEWEHSGPRVGQFGYSRGELWGWWLPGRFWVVRDRMTMVACG